MKNKKIIAAAVCASALALNTTPLAISSNAAEEDFSGYVLMNIPFSEFYSAEKAEIGDVDAISSATNKYGNYGKAGGGYHSGPTAAIAEDGTITAVGTENGAKMQGVTWAVKVESLDAVKALGGIEITDESTVTMATFAKGKTSSSTLAGYQVLAESPSYSYYVLDTAPTNYMVLDGTTFKESSTDVISDDIDAEVSYNTKWGDVELKLNEAENANGKLINAMVVTADDGTTKGFYHIEQIWAYNELAWNIDTTPELDGKKITNIRYYCSEKDADLTDSAVPTYANYVYDYRVNLDVLTVYNGETSAEFRDAGTISVTGLPTDIKNPVAAVSSVVARGETPVVIADGVAVNDNTIKTTDNAVSGTSYKIVVTSDNYGDISITIPYETGEQTTAVTTTTAKVTTTTAITSKTIATSVKATTTENTGSATSSPNTGVAGVAASAALLTISSITAIALRKKND